MSGPGHESETPDYHCRPRDKNKEMDGREKQTFISYLYHGWALILNGGSVVYGAHY